MATLPDGAAHLRGESTISSDNKELVRRAYEAIEKADFGTLESLIAHDMVEHEVVPGFEPNKDGVLKFFGHLRSAFPDMTVTAHDMVSEDDRVFVRLTMAGTHEGEFMGMPATGKKVSVPMADFIRLEDGKLAEHWGVTDMAVMMEQLGGSPS